MNKKKIQYSKLLPLFTIIIFSVSLWKAFSIDLSNMYDLSIYATAITVSGSMCLTSIVYYMKNSQAEKVAKIKVDTYRVASEERLKYNEKMIKLKIKYNISSDEISEIEEKSPMDEFEDVALENLDSYTDSLLDEATSSIEIQDVI